MQKKQTKTITYSALVQRSKSVDRPRDHAGMASVAGVTGSHPPPATHHPSLWTPHTKFRLQHTHTSRLASRHDNPTVWSELTWMVVTVILTHSHCSHCPVLKIKTLSSVLLQIPHHERKTRPSREFRRQPGLCSRPPKRIIKWDEKQQHKVVVFFFYRSSVLKIKIHTKKGWTWYKKSPSNGNENAIKPLKAGVHDEGRTFTPTAVMNEKRERKSIKLRSCQKEAAVKSCWVVKLKAFTASWMFPSSNKKTEECWCFAWCWCSTAEGPLLHWNHFNSLLESQCYNTQLWSSPLWCHKRVSVGVTKPRVRWWLRPLTMLDFVFISSQTCGRLNNKSFFWFPGNT